MKRAFLLFQTVGLLLATACSPQNKVEAPTDASTFPDPAAFVNQLDSVAPVALDYSYAVMERAPRPYNFSDIPQGWIQEAHIPALLEMADSEEECFVVPTDPNCLATCVATTKGNIARQLLTTYVNGMPASTAQQVTPRTKNELKAQLQPHG